MGKLTANGVKAVLSQPGTYQDGDGLFLKVDRRGGASWLVRVQRDGKRRDFGLGSAKLVTLARARELASEIRRKVRVDGVDPIVERRQSAAAAMTFEQAALALHAEHNAWHNDKRKAQWLAALKRYAFPSLGGLEVRSIEASDIIAAISKVWSEKPETGRRIRGRICAVLDFAHAKGWRDREAPARSLAAGKGLPKQPARNVHRLAMPYASLPAFVASLRERFSFGRLALEFVILTAARSVEVRGATWGEIDLDAAIWTVPATRMKARREHVVPLSAQALAVLSRARAMRADRDGLIFPSPANGKAMSDMALLKVLRDAREDYHVHGFRSTFRTWASEQTGFPSDVCEAALAHQNPNRVEAAYARGALLDKRRKLMAAWGSYVDGASAQVLKLSGAAR
ncbi:MAG: tyrosine-type recombinase/integrase [Sphingomonas sp.]|nr:tyrosine-type recombinase/integrase [Sphingomonas sp.]